MKVIPHLHISGEDCPAEERIFRDLWEDETQRDVVIESLKADCEVRSGRGDLLVLQVFEVDAAREQPADRSSVPVVAFLAIA